MALYDTLFSQVIKIFDIYIYMFFFFYHVPFCGCFGFNVLVYFPHLQLDVTSAQLLVTDNDFRDKAFRNQLSETVQSLLALKVIPIFNENDAVSTRRAPYEVCYHF